MVSSDAINYYDISSKTMSKRGYKFTNRWDNWASCVGYVADRKWNQIKISVRIIPANNFLLKNSDLQKQLGELSKKPVTVETLSGFQPWHSWSGSPAQNQESNQGSMKLLQHYAEIQRNSQHQKTKMHFEIQAVTSAENLVPSCNLWDVLNQQQFRVWINKGCSKLSHINKH